MNPLSLLIVIHIVCVFIALFSLRDSKISDVAKALWVLIAFLFPIIGLFALFIVNPEKE